MSIFGQIGDAIGSGVKNADWAKITTGAFATGIETAGSIFVLDAQRKANKALAGAGLPTLPPIIMQAPAAPPPLPVAPAPAPLARSAAEKPVPTAWAMPRWLKWTLGLGGAAVAGVLGYLAIRKKG